LAKDVFQIKKGFGRVKEAKIRLEREELKNVELLKKYDAVRTDEYRERLIREQLNMQKEGEVIAVLPTKIVDKSVPENSVLSGFANWEKWLNLIR